ncbi:MAG: hypothetical protein RJQ04_17285, partial [Longimicrobiales bacterium]
MTRDDEARILAFLEGELEEDERERLLARVEAEPEMAAALRAAARGMAGVRTLDPGESVGRRRRVRAWGLAVAAAVG